ncbi:exopolysaccharide biosynthesis polyprenyl glycosylphosphotransferase [Hyphobacterium marinum]|uniref:Exopolysaccharide biosynthesis polyprenyl glycosylphosphotransferase n=1 Tax=Hyphobacterium marinum TaxID=3116574 RepID=A0ABU7LYZ7_9PROT|nr:exopolysaccharide biosynthesis polyprenyl glycosylphosphotransferase [Hyphobacterium sp. Y6023]MEE2566781.1 exopolysaccharide biosynthesis polyprenyl glycosylphosphotransferase [Hyphobacterium sp. Y6023]
MSDRRPAFGGPNAPANDLSAGFRAQVSGVAAMALAEARAAVSPPQDRIDRAALGRALQLTDTFVLLALCVATATMFAPLLWPMLVMGVLSACAMRTFSLYRVTPSTPAWDRMARTVVAAGLAGLLTLGAVALAQPALLPAAAVESMVMASALGVLHLTYAFFIQYWSKSGRLAANIVVIGATANARKLIEANRRSAAVNIIGVFDDRRSRAPSRLAGTPYLGDLDDLAAWPLLHEVDRIVITVTPKAAERVRLLLKRLGVLPQPVCLLLDFDDFDPSATSLEAIADAPAAQLSGTRAEPGWLILKRLEDLVIGSLMFAAALPVMALLALLVKLDSPGPALFRQTREGFNGRPITVLKFRSMRTDKCTANGAVRQVERDDPRVTRIGRILRLSSLDELPQLWNVLTGDMSLVGPRPHAPGMTTGAAPTSSLVAEYAHRHRVKPGLTGWAQVNGSRGPLHTPEAARERVRYDVEYIARASLWFDLWIMLRTLPALLGDKINIR